MEQTDKKYLLKGFPLYASVELFYWFGYSASSFFSAYLASKGFAVSLVGYIMAIVNLVGVFSAPIMGNISDRTGSPRRTFMLCAGIVTISALLIPFGVSHKVLSVSLAIPLYIVWGMFCKPMTGLCDSWFLGVIDRGANFSFGSIRYIGSIGYALMCVCYSFAAKKTGSQDVIFFMYALFSVLTFLLCTYAGRVDMDAPKPTISNRKQKNSVGIIGAIKNYHLVIYLVCHCLMNMPMYCSITFIPYKLLEMTGEMGSLGFVTALRSLAEIPSLILGMCLVRKIGIRKSIMIVMLGFAVVQILFIFAGSVMALVIAMMIMGFINGGMMAFQMKYIKSIIPQESLSSAVTLCTAMALVSAMVGNAIGGVLVENFGTWAYFVFAMCLEVLALGLFAVSVPVGNMFGIVPPQNDKD